MPSFKPNKKGDEKTKLRQKVSALKSELNQLLSQKLIPKGISTKYLTSNPQQDLLATLMQTMHETTQLPTIRTQTALQDMKKV